MTLQRERSTPHSGMVPVGTACGKFLCVATERYLAGTCTPPPSDRPVDQGSVPGCLDMDILSEIKLFYNLLYIKRRDLDLATQNTNAHYLLVADQTQNLHDVNNKLQTMQYVNLHLI